MKEVQEQRSFRTSDEVGWVIETLSALVGPLGSALPATTEVVLHDLSLLPTSIVAIHGDVTGRKVGDPSTDLLLKMASSGSPESKIGYETRLPDGRIMKSSTIIVRDSNATPVAALCVNTDLSTWQQVHRIAELMLGLADVSTASLRTPSEPALESEETFASDVDELAAHLLRKAIDRVGVPVPLMHKHHKVEVVRELSARGFFLLKGAAEAAAAAMDISRFSVYNYLNEITGKESPDPESRDTEATDADVTGTHE